MKILTTFTQDYLKMFNETFLPSLPENTDLIYQYHNYELEDCKGKFGSHDTLYKLPFILNTLETCEEGETIFYCDVDIVILDDNIEEHIRNLEPADFYIQWDNPDGGVCLGCMVLKNTEPTRKLFRDFLEKDVDWILTNYGVSLNYFKSLLDKGEINYKVLPPEFYGGQMILHNIKVPTPYLYHATFEKTLEDKTLTLKKYLNNKFIPNGNNFGLKFLILLMYYNRPELVKTALKSIQDLKYDNWELAIVDDGSDVSIDELAKSMIPNDKLIYYRVDDTTENKIKRGNSIHGKYLNQAILESTSDIVIPLCDDDALIDDYLNNLDLYFTRNQHIKYAYSNVYTFDPNKGLTPGTTERHLNFGYQTVAIRPDKLLDSSQVVFRTNCFKNDGVRYPFPKTRDLDAVVFEQAFNRYGACNYTGFCGQYKALFSGQLGFRKNTFEYIS